MLKMRYTDDGRPVLDVRFWSKVEKTGGCWLWTASTDTNGYGLFGIGGSGNTTSAHRLAYASLHGPIPPDKEVRHRCDTPPCVKDAHLVLGTHHQNMQDAVERRRISYGTRVPRARLNDVAVCVIRHLFAKGVHPKRLASVYGIPRSNVDTIVRGETWKHVGGPIRPYRYRLTSSGR